MENKLAKLKMAIGISALLGLLFGPIFWYESAQFYGEYDELLQKGKKSTAVVVAKRAKQQFRYQKFMLELNIPSKDGKMEKIQTVSVNALLFDKLKIGNRVSILSNKESSILTANYQNENVPPIKKRYLGMILTLVSAVSLLILRLVSKRNG
jgi:hypothetical protein